VHATMPGGPRDWLRMRQPKPRLRAGSMCAQGSGQRRSSPAPLAGLAHAQATQNRTFGQVEMLQVQSAAGSLKPSSMVSEARNPRTDLRAEEWAFSVLAKRSPSQRLRTDHCLWMASGVKIAHTGLTHDCQMRKKRGHQDKS